MFLVLSPYREILLLILFFFSPYWVNEALWKIIKAVFRGADIILGRFLLENNYILGVISG